MSEQKVLTSDQVKGRVVEIIRRHLPDQKGLKIFLFGSRAGNSFNSRSDYDFGIEAAGEVPAPILFEIKNEIDEIPVLQRIDIVDFNRVSKTFREIALASAEILYEGKP